MSAMLLTRKVRVTYLVGQEGRKDIFAKLESRVFARILSREVKCVGNNSHKLKPGSADNGNSQHLHV